MGSIVWLTARPWPGRAELDKLAVHYQVGKLMTERAGRCGSRRRTVSDILTGHGMVIQVSGLSPEQIQHAVLMYSQGQSMAERGTLLSVDTGTLHGRPRE